jgi:hypothetical protein
MDMDIDNYTVDDILTIFNIVDPTVFNVTDVANTLIAKMKTDGKTDMMDFFGEARDKVLNYLQSMGKDPVANERTELVETVWADPDSGFNDTTPDKPVRYFDDGSHITAQQNTNTSAAEAAATVPIISTHLIIIDSQYRSNILPYSNSSLSSAFNTNFTFNLTNQITKAISIKLYSYQIPTTWNAFSATAGNTFFLYNGIIINIPDGNYTLTTLIAAIQAAAALNIATAALVITYNTDTNRISLMNNDPLLNTVTVIFFIQSNTVNFSNCGNFVLSNFQTLGVNTTLGWLLGFRTTPNATTGDVELLLPPLTVVTADVAPDTYGPKYFTLSVEDYSNTRLSSGLYNITNTKSYASLSVQDYYNTTAVACKLREGSLTQAQLYSINAVVANNTNVNVGGFDNTLTGPTSSSTLAIIPLADIKNIRPNPYIKFGADLYVNKRSYVKPTSLVRFTVSLTDDKGNLVNLYDNDWSFSLIVEERLN